MFVADTTQLITYRVVLFQIFSRILDGGGKTLFELSEFHWPQTPSLSHDVPGQRKHCDLVPKEETWDLCIFKRYQSLYRLVRVLSYCKRFAQNCKTKNNERIGYSRSVELSQPKIALARLSQKVTFSTEIKIFTAKVPITKGTLASLNAFSADFGILSQ